MDLLRYNLTLFFTSSCPRRPPELVNTVLFYHNLSLPLSQAPSRARAVSQRARAQQSALPGPSRRLPAPGLPHRVGRDAHTAFKGQQVSDAPYNVVFYERAGMALCSTACVRKEAGERGKGGDSAQRCLSQPRPPTQGRPTARRAGRRPEIETRPARPSKRRQPSPGHAMPCGCSFPARTGRRGRAYGLAGLMFKRPAGSGEEAVLR